jgi:hypothetical protein
MVEDVEELCIQPEIHVLGERNLFRQAHLRVGEMRSADVRRALRLAQDPYSSAPVRERTQPQDHSKLPLPVLNLVT